MNMSNQIVRLIGTSILVLISIFVSMSLDSMAHGEERQPINENEAKLIFVALGLEQIVAVRSRMKTVNGIEETAIWQNDVRGFPVAQFLVIELGSNQIFIRETVPSFTDQIRDWYPNVSVEFLDDGIIGNGLGRVLYQHYRVAGATDADYECLGVRQFFGYDTDVGGTTIVRGYGESAGPMGTKLILGEYCVGPNDKIDIETIKSVAGGIGFKGYAAPQPGVVLQDTNAAAPEAATQRSTEDTREERYGERK